MSSMASMTRRADDWLFAAAGPERLAMMRILVGLFSLTYLAVRLRSFLALADAPPSRFAPVGVLGLLDAPVPRGAVVAIVIGSVALGIAFLAGAWFRVSGPAFALSLLVASTYRSSWNQLLHFENLMVLHVLIVGFAHSADALSLDARRHPPRAPDDRAYGWPVRLAGTVTVATYVLAGVAKLRIGGIGWMLGDTLRNHAAYSAARLELLGGTASPLAGPLVAHAWMFPPLAVATVIVELSAPVALFGGRIRTVWVVSAWAMHLSIAALMYVVFPYPLLLVAFAPLYRLEHLPGRIRNAPGRLSPLLAGHRPRRPSPAASRPRPARSQGVAGRR
ncbi:MAG: HTTM domain-containing protein [Acidimicrobiales bacterium]